MTKNARTFVIIGSDGMVGGALYSALKHEDMRVLGTSRCSEQQACGKIFFDLRQGLPDLEIADKIDVVFLCAGETSIRKCRERPKETYYINVTKTVEVARFFAERGAKVILFSTNFVFDGTVPKRKESDQVSPITEYGKQKVEVEKQLHSLGEQLLILRLTKVVSGKMPFLCEWKLSLQKGQAIFPFRDMVLSPVLLEFLIALLKKVSSSNISGILHVSGNEDITYDRLARSIALKVGAGFELINTISYRDKGIPQEEAPRHAALDTTRLETELGMRVPDLSATVELLLKGRVS